jgi:hypothetical protein
MTAQLWSLGRLFTEKPHRKLEQKLLSGEEVREGDVFQESPVHFFLGAYDEVFKDIAALSGRKLRVPVAGPRQLVDAAKILPIFADHVVFSPAPLAPTNGDWGPWLTAAEAKKLRKDFVFAEGDECGFFRRAGVTLTWGSSYSSMLALLHPLISRRFASFLPASGERGVWDRPELGIVSPPAFRIMFGPDDERHYRVEQLISLLCMEHVVSHRLGCEHVYSRIVSAPLVAADIPIRPRVGARTAALLRLKIPYLKGISMDDFSRILADEHEALVRYRTAIGTLIAEIPEDLDDDRELSRILARLQRQGVDEPLALLQQKLDRIARFSRYRAAGVATGSLALAYFALAVPGLYSTISGAIGSVSLIPIVHDWLRFLEEKSKLRDESFYFLLRLANESR